MIVLLGASGYVGSAFLDEIKRRDMAVATPRHIECERFYRFQRILHETKADLVINAAAFVTKPSVDLCEDHKVETLLGNLVFPTIISSACEAEKIPLIHVSTGCLFNGEKGGAGYTETDPPQLTFDQGAGFYVGSKQVAEQDISQYERAYICRIRLPFDEFDNPRNLLTKLQLFKSVCDENQSITHRGDFVKTCLDLWQKHCPYGTYNCTSPGAVEYSHLCDRINWILHGGKKRFEFISPREFDSSKARTIKSRCVLSTGKLLSAGIIMRPVGDAIEDSLANWKPL